MSIDFAIIPASFTTVDKALQACDAMQIDQLGDPPAAVAWLIAELDRIGADDEETGFLSLWPVSGCPLGIVLCTRWPKWDHTIYTLLDLTKDRGLAMVDLQLRQVLDPRGRVDATVTIANGTKLPYLTESIVRDVMAHQQHYGDYLIAETAENTYMQAVFENGRPCQIEYRAGSADQHYQAMVNDRELVPQLFAAWLRDGPSADLLRTQAWSRLEL